MKASVDRDVCMGAAVCTSVAPEVFEIGRDGLSSVANPDAATDELLREAAEGCPVQAIILEDDEGNQVYP